MTATWTNENEEQGCISMYCTEQPDFASHKSSATQWSGGIALCDSRWAVLSNRHSCTALNEMCTQGWSQLHCAKYQGIRAVTTALLSLFDRYTSRSLTSNAVSNKTKKKYNMYIYIYIYIYISLCNSVALG